MEDNSQREQRAKPAHQAPERLRAPACVHVYVWVFMVVFSVSPILCLLAACDRIERSDALESLVVVGLIQAALWIAQQRCSSEDLTYWEGLLGAAASVTTGENLVSLLRAFPLLLAVVILSVMFALDHDAGASTRHPQLRFGRLIIWIHRRRLWR